jgi:hypothetical protein
LHQGEVAQGHALADPEAAGGGGGRRTRGAVQAGDAFVQGRGEGGADGAVRLEEIAQIGRVVWVLSAQSLDLRGRGIGVCLEEGGQDLLGGAVGIGGGGQGSGSPPTMMATPRSGGNTNWGDRPG